jgi:hypothetical protein
VFCNDNDCQQQNKKPQQGYSTRHLKLFFHCQSIKTREYYCKFQISFDK